MPEQDNNNNMHTVPQQSANGQVPSEPVRELTPMEKAMYAYTQSTIGSIENNAFGNESVAGYSNAHEQESLANDLGWTGLSEKHKYLTAEKLDEYGARDQSFWNKAMMGAGKFTTGAIVGIGQSVLSLFDGAKYLAGGDGYTDTGIIESAFDKLSDWSAEHLKIYGGSKMGFNSSYIIESLSSLGTTYGLIAGNSLMAMAFASTGPGGWVAGALRVSAMARRLMSVGRAVAMGVQTSAMNAREGAKNVFDEVYAKYGDREMALRAANKQFASDFNKQIFYSIALGNVVDRIGMRAMGNLMGNRITAAMAKQGVHTPSTFMQRATRFSRDFVKNSIHEGLEEGAEEWMTESSMSKTLADYNIHHSINWDNITNSFVVGAISGGSMHGLSKISDKVKARRDKNNAVNAEGVEGVNATDPGKIDDNNKKIFLDPRQKREQNRNDVDDIVREGKGKPKEVEDRDYVDPKIFPPEVNSNKVPRPDSVDPSAIDPNTGQIIEDKAITPSNRQVDEQGNPVVSEPVREEDRPDSIPNTGHTEKSADDVFKEEGFAEEEKQEQPKKQEQPEKKEEGKQEADENELGEQVTEKSADDLLNEGNTEEKKEEGAKKDNNAEEEGQATEEAVEEGQAKEVEQQEGDQKQGEQANNEQGAKESEAKDKGKEGEQVEDENELGEPVTEKSADDLLEEGQGSNHQQPNEGEAKQSNTVDEDMAAKKEADEKGVKPATEQQSEQAKQGEGKEGAKASTDTEAKAEPKQTKREKEEEKDIKAVQRKASLEVSALEDRIDKDLDSFGDIILSEEEDKALQFYDAAMEGLQRASESETPTSGNPELDGTIQEYGELEKQEYRDTLDVASSLKENYMAFRSKGYSKLVALDLARKATKILFLKKRLAAINGDISNIREESSKGAIDKAIGYIVKRFPFLSTNKLSQSLQYKLSSRYYKQYKSSLEAVIAEEEGRYPENVDAAYVMSVISDNMDLASYNTARDSIRETIILHKLDQEPAFKSVLAILDAIDKNQKEGKDPFDGSIGGMITPDLAFKISEFLYLQSKYNNANEQDKVIYKKRMLMLFLNIKDTLEYRNQREVATTDVLNLIYRVLDGSDLDPNILSDISVWLGGTPDFVVTKSDGNLQGYSGSNQLDVEFFEEQKMLKDAFEKASNPNSKDAPKDYKSYYDIYKNRLNIIKDSLKDSGAEKVIKYIDSLLAKLDEVKDTTDRDKFLQASKEIQAFYNAFYRDKRDAIVSPTQHTLGSSNYDKSVNNKEEYEGKNPGKDRDKEDRVLLNEDTTGNKGKETDYGGEGTKLEGKSESKGKTVDEVANAPVKVTNSNGEGFEIPPVNGNTYGGGVSTFNDFYARAVYFSSVGEALSLQIDYNDSQSLDNATLHYGNKARPISDAVPDDFDIEFVTADTPPPKDGLVNREPVHGRIRHRRVLQDGRVVEMPVNSAFTDDTRKIVANIGNAYHNFKDGKATEDDMKVIETIKKEYGIDITKGRGVIDALGKFIATKGVDGEGNPYKIYMKRTGEVRYAVKNRDITDIKGDGEFPFLHPLDITLAPDEERMNRKDNQHVFSVLLGEPISHNEYLKRNLYTKYHTLKHNGKFITFFNPKHRIKIDLKNVDLDKLLSLLEQVRDQGLFTRMEDADQLKQTIEDIKELKRGFKTLPSKGTVSNQKEALKPEEKKSEPKHKKKTETEMINPVTVKKEDNNKEENKQDNKQEDNKEEPTEDELGEPVTEKSSDEAFEEQNQSDPKEEKEEFSSSNAENNESQDTSETATQPVDDGSTNEFSSHNVINPISRDGSLRIGKRKVVNVTGKYSDAQVLAHIEEFDIMSDFVYKAVVTDVLRELHHAGKDRFNGKVIEEKINRILDQRIKQFQERLGQYKNEKVKAKADLLILQLQALRSQDKQIKGIIYQQLKSGTKETSYDDRPAFKDDFDSPTTQFMRSVPATDPLGRPYVDPFGMPVYYDYADVAAIFYAAIDNSNGTIRSLDDMIKVLNRLTRHRIANDVMNALKALPPHLQNKIVMKYAKVVVDRAVTIDRDGRARDADTYGAIAVAIRTIRQVIRDIFSKFNPDGSVALNRKSYDEFMHNKHMLLSDSTVYRQIAFMRYYELGSQYAATNKGGHMAHEMLANILNNTGKYSGYDVVKMLNVFGYDPKLNPDFLSAPESHKNAKPEIMYISSEDNAKIKEYHDELDRIKNDRTITNKPEMYYNVNQKLLGLVKKIAAKNNVKTKQVLDKNTGQVVGYNIDYGGKIGDKPFDAKSIQKLLSMIGINVHYKAVDKFFNDEVLLDNEGNVVSFAEAYAMRKYDNRYKDIIARAKDKIALLNNIVLYGSSLNNGALLSSLGKNMNSKQYNRMATASDASKAIEVELERLLAIHYKNNPFGTKATSKLGDVGSSNYSASNMITETLSDMKNNPREYWSIPLYQNNMLLSLWFSNPDAAEKTRLDHIHSKVFDDDMSSDTRLNKKRPHEIEYAHLALYYSNLPYNGTEYNDPQYGRLKMRSMPFPVVSDKNKSPIFTVPTLSINDDAIIYAGNGFFFNVNNRESRKPNDRISREEQELNNANTGERLARNVVDNLFGSELRRAIAFAKSSPINRKAMNTGARFFYSIPEFNNMTDENGVTILDHIFSLNDNSKSEDEVYNEIYDKFFGDAKTIIERRITSEVEYLLSDTADPATFNVNDKSIRGFLVKQFNKEDEYWEILRKKQGLSLDEYIEGKVKEVEYNSDINENDKEFAKKQAEDKARLTYQEANDFLKKKLSEYVINNMLNYNNTHTLFIGDPASFSNVKKATNPDGSVNVNKLVYDATTNMFKRWGGAIGTTNKIPHKEGEKYSQIILQDEVGVSNNIGHLARLYYPNISKSDVKGLESLVDNYDGDKAKALSKKYPLLGSHLDITKTDAQEYITWQEAFRFMEGSGELSGKQLASLKNIYNKLSSGKKLNDSEHRYFMNSYNAIINTQKPLGASREVIYDESGRPMHLAFNYIKSSAVPLLPGFTAGTKLDSLRILMEDTERKTGMPVRAGYVSTMKADTVPHPLKLSDIHDNVSKGEHSKGDSAFSKLAKGATVTMSRSSWGQQQRFPNHQQEEILAGSNKSDIVSSTQLQSMLFDKGSRKDVTYSLESHDSIIEEFNAAFPDAPIKDKNNISGSDLERLYGFASNQMLMSNANSLKQMMGKGWKDLPKAIAATLEVSSPGNPLIEIIRNTPVDKLITSSNEKIHSIAHAFIRNNISTLRVNGLSLVAMSSAGLERSGRHDKSRIVYANGHKPGPLKDAYIDSNGVFHPAEVLMPSQFTTKDKHGNVVVIDLTSPKYSERDPETGALTLKKGVIDDRLLEGVGIRTPYSNLNSGSAYKIVGFLPQEMGNAIVLPPSIIAQKGADNDGDKEYVQLYNYSIDDNGRITKDDNVKGRTGNGRTIAYSNVLLDISRSIYKNTNPEIQREISKPISSAPISNTLEFVGGMNSSNSPSFLSKSYQTSKSMSATVGKDGMSYFSYSNVVFSMLNRASKKGDKPIVIYPMMSGEKGLVIGAEAQGSLSKADFLSILQNEAVDNAKNDNMWLMNATKETIPLYNGLVHVGFGKHVYGDSIETSKSGFLNVKGKDGKEYNLPILMMTTPVMRKLAGYLADNNTRDVYRAAHVAEIMAYDNYLMSVKKKYKLPNEAAYGHILSTGDKKLIALVNKVYGSQLSKASQDVRFKIKLPLHGNRMSVFSRLTINDYGGELDYKFKEKETLKDLFDEFHNSRDVDYEALMTPENLMALSVDERDSNGNLVDADGNIIDELNLTTAILMKAVQAHYANSEVAKTGSAVNKTHEPPQNAGEYAAKLMHIVNTFNNNGIGAIGEYSPSGDISNPFDLANDILDNIVPNTSEGAKLIASMRNIRDMYRAAYPEYEQIMKVAFGKIKNGAEFHEISKFITSALSEYNKFKRAKLFANSKEGLDNLLEFLFDTNTLMRNKDGRHSVVDIRSGEDTPKDLAYKIGFNRGSHVMWRDNKLLNALSLNLGPVNDQRIYIPFDLLEDGSLTQAFNDLLQDNNTVIMREYNEDGSVKASYTARDVAFMLAAYANFSENTNLSRVIPDSFYEALGESDANDIELFFDQYSSNKSDHMYSFNNVNNAKSLITSADKFVHNNLEDHVEQAGDFDRPLRLVDGLHAELYTKGLGQGLFKTVDLQLDENAARNIKSSINGLIIDSVSPSKYISQKDRYRGLNSLDITSSLAAAYYERGVEALGPNVSKISIYKIIKAGYDAVTESLQDLEQEPHYDIMKAVHDDVGMILKSGANIIHFNGTTKQYSYYTSDNKTSDKEFGMAAPKEVATAAESAMKVGYMTIERNQEVHYMRSYANGKSYMQTYTRKNKILLKHVGDGKFMVVPSYEGTPITYYNPFNSNEVHTTEAKFELPARIESLDANPTLVDKRFLYDNVLKPLYGEYGLSPYQKNMLSEILGKSRINMVNNSGTYVKSVGTGIYTVNVIGDMKDISDVYSKDSVERNYRLNDILRQAYGMYSSRHTTKSTKGYVNALLSYREGDDTSELEKEHRALYPNDKRSIKDILNGGVLSADGKTPVSTGKAAIKPSQVQAHSVPSAVAQRSEVPAPNSNMKPQVIDINANLAPVEIKGDPKNIDALAKKIVRQEVKPPDNDNVPKKCN